MIIPDDTTSGISIERGLVGTRAAELIMMAKEAIKAFNGQ
jgi:hypothetical protein